MNIGKNLKWLSQLMFSAWDLILFIMSSESIDLLWNDSIKELKQLVKQEEEIHDDEEKPVSASDAFRHFAKLYIRYTIVLADLNHCLDKAVQPQKRLDIHPTLEHVICRVINLRQLLAKWCPPNPDVLPKDEGVAAVAPFPWEYFDISTELRELYVAPLKLETATPVFLEEDALSAEGAKARRHRNFTVARLLEEKFGSKFRPLEEKNWSIESSSESQPLFDGSPAEELSHDDVSDEAICETPLEDASSGEGESSSEEETLEEESDDDLASYETNGSIETLREQFATIIQSTVRGHLSRRKTKDVKQWLDNFVGLSSSTDTTELDKLENNLVDIRHQRKQEQQYCKESYENDLHRLQDVVRVEEGFAMQNALREERIQWITEHVISKNTLPDSFEGFCAKNGDTQKENEDTQKDKKKKKDPKGAKAKGGKDDKKSKGKKSAAVEVERPVLAAPPTLLGLLRDSIQIYEERWQHRTVGPDRIASQYHDVEMAKDLIIRDQIKTELTKDVEEKLLSNVLKIKAMQEANSKKKKKKNGKKGKGKKGKKGKGGKKGGKKEKPLPGAKLPGMKKMTADEMLAVLVQNGLVCTPDEMTINDFIGGFENGRPKIPDIDKQERWIPDDPSAFQLRKAVMDYCILPFGSESIRANIQDRENVRSILFYGPEGSGKTRMVQTIASEIGALLIHLSSSKIGRSFGGKEGATKLIHMVFTVARERANAPVVICLDGCHEFFMGKSKKGGSSEMQRFQKDLLVYKNQSLKKEDRVLVVGCTNDPGLGDVKLLRWKGPAGKPEKQGFFERALYFPRANHADRATLWKGLVRRRVSAFDARLNAPDMDYASLAFLSDGFNAGEISSAVNAVLSEDRVKAMVSEPLTERDFANYLARDKKAEERRDGNDERYLAFTRQITTLDSTWKSINTVEKKKKK